MTIKAGSFSRLDVFETCPLRAKLAFIDKIPEPDRGPPPKGLTEWQNDRGTRIHEHADRFTRGVEDTQIPEMEKFFKAEFERLRTMHADGKVLAEEMWCYDAAWKPCGDRDWSTIKFRVKTDATIWLDGDTACVVDFKTGKRWGNEVKHAQQAQLYALGTALRYDEVQKIHTELWYVDQDELIPMTMTRSQALRFFKNWDDRNSMMLASVNFEPRPNKINCKWCPYGPKGTGHCTVGVQ